MPRSPRPSTLLAATLLVAVLLAGCGGDDDDGAATTASTASTPSSSTPEGATPDSPTSSSLAGKGPAVPSAGCASSAAAAAAAKAVREEKRTIRVEGPAGSTERFFLLTSPAQDSDTPVPLVLDLHGLSEGAQVHTLMSAFSDLAEQEGFAVAFPNGTGTPVQWDTSLDADTSIDLAFVGAMLDTLGRDLCLDESRVYATGLSNGAMMSSALACALSDRIAAVAPVAGVTKADGCDPGRPVPVLAFHGTADDILLFNGGVGGGLGRALSGAETSSTTTVPVDLDGEGYPATVAAWAEHNGCEPDPRNEDVGDEVTKRIYDCPDGADVEFFIVEGGGHTWPGSEFSKAIANIVGPTTFDIDATEEIWAFFERFRLP